MSTITNNHDNYLKHFKPNRTKQNKQLGKEEDTFGPEFAKTGLPNQNQ